MSAMFDHPKYTDEAQVIKHINPNKAFWRGLRRFFVLLFVLSWIPVYQPLLYRTF